MIPLSEYLKESADDFIGLFQKSVDSATKMKEFEYLPYGFEGHAKVESRLLDIKALKSLIGAKKSSGSKAMDSGEPILAVELRPDKSVYKVLVYSRATAKVRGNSGDWISRLYYTESNISAKGEPSDGKPPKWRTLSGGKIEYYTTNLTREDFQKLIDIAASKL